MLTKLTPEQISKFWDIIKYAVEESLPPISGDHPDKMNNILTACLNGTMDVWASYIRSEEGNKFEGIVITEFLFDPGSKTRNLLIYCLYGYENVSRESWEVGYKAILKYAKAKHCNQIVAYTNLPLIINLVKGFGGEAEYTFISFNVRKSLEALNG